MKNMALFSAWAMFLFCSRSWASNGDVLIGASAASTALGGTGVANYTNDTDAVGKNPALLVHSSSKAGAIAIEANASYFKQNASADVGTGAKDSQKTAALLPGITGSYRLSDSLGFGLGFQTLGGGLADYKGEVNHAQLKNDFGIMRLSPSVGYRIIDEVSVGASPFIAAGSFALNEGLTGTQSGRSPHWDLGLGAMLGATFKPMAGLVIGAAYTSKSSLTYKSIVNLDAFGPNAANAALADLDDVTIDQPQEFSLGASYQALEGLTVTADYRFINWASADGYQQFDWQNQNVIALGAQYSCQQWDFRLGFNYAKSPIREATGEAGDGTIDLQGHSLFRRSVSMLNIIAFPAVAETHFTFGAGYDVTSDVTVDLAFVYAPKVTVVRAGTFTGTSGYSFTGTVSQWSLTGSAAYRL